MTRRSTTSLWLLFLVGALTACQTRLPVDGTVAGAADVAAVAVEPAPDLEAAAKRPSVVSQWRAALANAREAESLDPRTVRLEPDRLRDVIRYRPLVSPRQGLLHVMLVADTCAPGEHP